MDIGWTSCEKDYESEINFILLFCQGNVGVTQELEHKESVTPQLSEKRSIDSRQHSAISYQEKIESHFLIIDIDEISSVRLRFK